MNDLDPNPFQAIWVGLLPREPCEMQPNKIYRAETLEKHGEIILEAVREGYVYISLGLELEAYPHIAREDIYAYGGKILSLAALSGLKLMGNG